MKFNIRDQFSDDTVLRDYVEIFYFVQHLLSLQPYQQKNK